VTGDVTPEYLAKLEVERNDGAKERRERQRPWPGIPVVEVL
jgi:hypothetical protein